MQDAIVVAQLAGPRPIVQLAHARQRTEGVVGVWWRDDAAIAICAHSCGLTALPEAIGSLAQLERLEIGANQLTELPALPAALRELYIHDNRITQLPDLPALAGIDFVYLAGNRLTALPEIRGVRYLNVCDNPLRHLVLSDPEIQELRAEHSELHELSIEPLVGLRELSLRGNQLATLPASIGGHPALRVLDLRSNQLDALPESLRALPLTKLDLRWNPLRDRPPWLAELVDRGCLVYT